MAPPSSAPGAVLNSSFTKGPRTKLRHQSSSAQLQPQLVRPRTATEREELLKAEKERWMQRLTGLRPLTADVLTVPPADDRIVDGIVEADVEKPSPQLAALFAGPLKGSAWQARPATAPTPDVTRGSSAVVGLKAKSRWGSDAGWRGGNARSISAPSLKTEFRGRLPPHLEAAADAFDKRHQAYKGLAEQSLAYAKREPHLDMRHVDFRAAHRDLLWNRFVDDRVDEAVEEAAPPPAQPTHGSPTPDSQKLDDGIWAPRKQCDSRAFYDSLLCWKRALDRDFARAVAAGLGDAILARDVRAGTDQEAAAIEEVSSALWERHELLYATFTHYGSMGDSEDVFTVDRAACVQFVLDCKLDRSGRNKVDKIIAAIDGSRSARAKKLNRQEWLQLIVRIAMAKYARNGRTVANAVRQLITEAVASRVDRTMTANPNLYRRDYLYKESVGAVLRRYESSLRLVYICACALDPYAMQSGSHLLSHAAFKKLLNAVDLTTDDDEDYSDKIYDEDFTGKDATLCFIWSRMLAVDETDVAKQTQLSFEDFLEALARVAGLKVWPTDDEVAAYGYGNSGTHLLRLESESPVAFAAMMRYRDPQWGAAPVRQSLARCVDHLCQWLIVILQGGLRRHPDNPIELSESQACFGFARVADMKVADLRALLAQHAEEPATADEAARPVTAPG